MFIKKTKSLLLTCLLAFAMCSIFTSTTFGQQILRVDNSAGGTGDGQSWPNAITSLQLALNIANVPNSGNWEIRVAKGNGPYKPFDQITPFRIIDKTGVLPSGSIVLLGGYAGDGAPNPDLRDPKANPTILSGDILGNDDDPFTADLDYLRNAQLDDNAFTVLMVIDSGQGNRIDGFIIERSAQGTDFGFFENRAGGGMLIRDSAIDVVNCTFRFNAVGIAPPVGDPPGGPFGNDGIGGGAMVIGSFVSGVEFTRFINCTFHDNFANQGGGLALFELTFNLTQALVLNCLFHDNRAIKISNLPRFPVAGSGGAIIAMGLTDANEAVPPHLPGDGGNLFIEITNCTIVNNCALEVAGGFFLWNVDELELVDGVVVGGYESIIQNSVFWHNNQGLSCNTLGGEIARQLGTGDHVSNLFVRYSDVEGGFDPSPDSPLRVEAVIDVDPLFVDELNKDFRVTATSPVLDAGHPQTSSIPLIPPDDFDLNGNNNIVELTPDLDLRPRVLDSQINGTFRVNMGAYESFFTCCADVGGFDHNVNVTDLLTILGAWGDCPEPCQFDPTSCVINSPDTCPADTNRDCKVNVTDLLAILGGWGSSCAFACNVCSTIPMIESTQFPSIQPFGGEYGPVSDKWILSGSTERRAADEFIPTLSTTVTLFNWWGFYDQAGTDCDSGYNDSFTITYYKSVLNTNTGQLVPGNVHAVFNNVNVFIKKATGDFVGNSPLYFYCVFHSAVNVTAGTTYFVEVKNSGGDFGGSSGCHWRWAWSEEGTLLYSVKNLENSGAYANSFEPENLMNLAFGLDIEFRQMELIIPDPEPDPDPDPPPPGGEEDPPGGGRVMG